MKPSERNPETLLSPEQWSILQSAVLEVEGLIGEVVEVGVFRGGSAKLLCDSFPDQNVICIDTFEGLPGSLVAGIDGHSAGSFSCSLKEVAAFLPSNAKLVKMLYQPPDNDPLEGKSLKLLHIDVDLYESVKRAIEANWPRIVPGGLIVCDDYNDAACRGAQKAVNDFCISNGIALHTFKISPQCIIKKPLQVSDRDSQAS